MRMYDLIEKKRNGGELSAEEIRWMLSGYVSGKIPDYQMSAMLMAIFFRGMTDEETSVMTDAVARSGDMMDLSPIAGVKVDKHSTGGVGDKTTLVIAPIAAACGVKVAKVSGRGLGHTGGTVDKLESIPGFRADLNREEFFAAVNKTGLAVIGQSGNMTPADKKLYALRDVTATVDSIPLIAVSIMGKKLAAGNDAILLDVTCGSGAFMKKTEDAVELAKKMVQIGQRAGKRMAALITDMDTPLGHCIGNILEVKESIEVLKDGGPEDLREACLALSSNMLYLADLGTLEECRAMAQEAIRSGAALQRLADMVEAQGGDSSYVLDTGKFSEAPYCEEVKAQKDGFITHMDTESCGIASVMLGAGRETVDSAIDPAAGIILQKKTGDAVKQGETIAKLYASDQKLFATAAERYQKAIVIGEEKPAERPLVLARVEKGAVEMF